ncbi:MAG: signal peptidase II [Syntrophaceticus schinkii]
MKKEILNVVLFFFTTFVLLAVDQVTKVVIVNHMRPGESIPVIERIFHITYVRNPGGAFGILAHRTEIFIVLAVLFIIIVLAPARLFPRKKPEIDLRSGHPHRGCDGQFSRPFAQRLCC